MIPALMVALIVAVVPQPTSPHPRAAPLWPGATAVWDGAPASERYTARCIVSKESLSAGLYSAQNPRSSASGVMQALDSTGRAWARALHIAWPGHERLLSHRNQDRSFRYGLRYDRQAWQEC